jgi:hypothetical protein
LDSRLQASDYGSELAGKRIDEPVKSTKQFTALLVENRVLRPRQELQAFREAA